MDGTARLRQVVVVARDLDAVEAEFLALLPEPGEPYHDPGVAEFGLRNSVIAVGDTFVEVVSPTRGGTTAGRYLERRGGDSGYMAIFQVPDMAAARRRIEKLGVRTVWQADLPDIAGTHLHPKDVPGAIVSLDTPDPPESWRWAGPAWTGGAPFHPPGGVVGLTIETPDPAAAAQRWSEILDSSTVPVTFRPGSADRAGIVAVRIAVDGREPAERVVAGVRFVVQPRVAVSPPGELA